MANSCVQMMVVVLFVMLSHCMGVPAGEINMNRQHGLVGLRPLPRTAEMEHGHNHGGEMREANLLQATS